MKIDFKATADQIHYLAQLFASQVGNFDRAAYVTLPMEHKVVVSIALGIADYFEKKFKKVSRDAGLFNEKKRYGLSLQYHEAYAVLQLIITTKRAETDIYRRAMAETLSQTLEKKLQ